MKKAKKPSASLAIRARNRVLLAMHKERYQKARVGILESHKAALKGLKEKHARVAKVATEWKNKSLAEILARYKAHVKEAKAHLAMELARIKSARVRTVAKPWHVVDKMSGSTVSSHARYDTAQKKAGKSPRYELKEQTS